MYKVKFGGKKGQEVSLIESPDLVAIRTKDNQDIEKVGLSRAAKTVVQESVEVAAFPEAGVTVRRVLPDAPPVAAMRSGGVSMPSFGDEPMAGAELESVAPPEPVMSRRDTARKVLKEEENIRFAGRVLQDAETGQVMLYTENFFVKFYDTTSQKECDEVIAKYHLTVKSKLPFAPNSYFVEAPEGTGLEVFNIAEKILEEKKVEYCHPEVVQERRFKLIHPLQWHLRETMIGNKPVDAHVNIEAAWKHTKGKGITIAVIDDGVDPQHPEFAGRIVHPFDATENIEDASPKNPDDNHGTACAGMACASGLNGGAAGTAPESTLMPIRLRSGLGSMAEANAFVWATDHGADVISCSWGPTDGEWWNPADPTHNKMTMLPDSTRLAIQYAMTKGRGGKGCVVLFAAGNGNEDTRNDGYVSLPDVIAVAACNDTSKRSVYSDFGNAVWVCFPSGDFGWRPFRHPAPITEGLRTTDRLRAEGYAPDPYVNSFGGTSGACPGMAGVIGLMLSANPELKPAQVKDLVRRSCVRIDETEGEYDATTKHSIYYGYGRIDAGLALTNALASKNTNGATAKGLSGTARFSTIGEIAIQPGQLVGDVKPARRLLGFTLKLSPAIPDLTLEYTVHIPNVGARSASEGQYLGTENARQRLLGFSINLRGKAAKDYDIEYAARLKDQEGVVMAKNGDLCGTDKNTGKTIEGIGVTLRKKK